jgi:hypothetical protein
VRGLSSTMARMPASRYATKIVFDPSVAVATQAVHEGCGVQSRTFFTLALE